MESKEPFFFRGSHACYVNSNKSTGILQGRHLSDSNESGSKVKVLTLIPALQNEPIVTLPETKIFAKMVVSKFGISFSRGPLFSVAFAVSFRGCICLECESMYTILIRQSVMPEIHLLRYMFAL